MNYYNIKMKTIKYKEYLELANKIFDNDKSFKNKVLVALSPLPSGDVTLDFSFYLTRGIDFTDYCLLDPILPKYKVFNKSDINSELNTEENRNNGVCGYVIFKPTRITEYAGQVQSYHVLTNEKFLENRFQHDIICGKTLEYSISKHDSYNVTNSWLMSYKLCYNIATQEDIDLIKIYNEGIKLNVGDKIPPLKNIEDSLINIEIIDKSVLIEKLEKAKEDFRKVFTETYKN